MKWKWIDPIRSVLALALTATGFLAGCAFDKPTKADPGTKVIQVRDERSLIQAFAEAYRTHNLALFTPLVANEPGAEYQFVLCAPTRDGVGSWDYATEVRIHKRMFEPRSLLPGEPPVPQELWLESIEVSLAPQGEFVERADLYVSEANPQGLDPARWRAREATYGFYALFRLQGIDSYQIDGRVVFVVLEDLQKQAGEAGKFRICRWEDLGGSVKPGRGAPGTGAATPSGVEPATWSMVKNLYRPLAVVPGKGS